jgi:transposase
VVTIGELRRGATLLSPGVRRTQREKVLSLSELSGIESSALFGYWSSMPDELAPLSEEARKLALDRFRILKPHLEHSRSLRSVALATGIPYRTAHRWLAQYRRFGLAALARKARVDRGERRAASVDLKQAIEGLAFQKPPLPIAALCRQAPAIAQQRGEAAPSYSVVYDIVHKLPADLLTLAHEGTKAYSNTFELVHRREAIGPNAIWQADHTPLDILLVFQTARPQSRGSPPSSTITAGRWPATFFRLKTRPH